MAVEMHTELHGMPREQVEALVAQVLPQIKAFPGFLTHASGPTDDGGYYVTELWESREAHERWLSEVIMPTMAQAGIAQPPQLQYRPADTVITR